MILSNENWNLFCLISYTVAVPVIPSFSHSEHNAENQFLKPIL